MVLGDPVTGKPITADYDLFAVGNKNGPGEVGPFDPDLGSISANERGTMLALNDGAKSSGYTGGNVVHHGPANRYANVLEAADWPVTAFTPDGNIHTIGNLEELNDFYATWRAAGYKLEAPDGWGLDPNFVPTGKFAPVTGPRTTQHAAAAAFLGASQACDDPAAETADGSDDPTSGEATGDRPTTGSGAAGGDDGGTQVSLGGFDGIPVVPYMNIAFGPMPMPTPQESYTSLPPRDSAMGVPVADGDMALLGFFARAGFVPLSESDIKRVFAGGVPDGQPPYLLLDFNLHGGMFKAGSFISLSRITGGSFANGEPGCKRNGKSVEHIHGNIDIDGIGPLADQNPGGCGHGVVYR
jgi:hypothetical protein